MGTGAGHRPPAAPSAGCHGVPGTQQPGGAAQGVKSDRPNPADLMQPLSPSPVAAGVGWDTPHPPSLHPPYGLSPRRPRTVERGRRPRRGQVLPGTEEGGPGALSTRLVLQDTLQALRDFQERGAGGGLHLRAGGGTGELWGSPPQHPREPCPAKAAPRTGRAAHRAPAEMGRLTLQQWKASWRKVAGQSIPTMVRKVVMSRPKSCARERRKSELGCPGGSRVACPSPPHTDCVPLRAADLAAPLLGHSKVGPWGHPKLGQGWGTLGHKHFLISA